MYKPNPITIITEERPVLSTIETIFKLLSSQPGSTGQKHLQKDFDLRQIKLIPTRLLDTFDVQTTDGISQLKIVHGLGPFPDYLAYQGIISEIGSTAQDTPILALEETKSTSAESRNMLWQRLTKLIALNKRFPHTKIPFYLHIPSGPFSKTQPISVQNALRALLTLGGSLSNSAECFRLLPFLSIGDLLSSINSTSAVATNTTVRLNIFDDRSTITIRLQKGTKQDALSDPNTGQLLAIAACLKMFGAPPLVVLKHGLSLEYLETPKRNKLVELSNFLNISFETAKGIKRLNAVPSVNTEFWKESNDEKLASIRLDILASTFGSAHGVSVVFSNHGGCELSYYFPLRSPHVTLGKQPGRPDLIIADDKTKTLFVLEAKKSNYVARGLQSLLQEASFLDSKLPEIDPHRANYTRAYGLLLFSDGKKIPPVPETTSIALSEFVVFERDKSHWLRLSDTLRIALNIQTIAQF